MPKAGVRGFLGDRPWVNDVKNSRDLLQSQLAYLRNAHTWAEMQDAVGQMNRVLSDPDIQTKPNLVTLLNEIKQNEIGHATVRWLGAAERAGSRWLGEAHSVLSKAFPPLRNLPTDLQSINTGIGWAKTYFYMMKLGLFNVPFAAMSVVQPVFTIPHHFRLSQEGYNHNFVVSFVDSLVGGLGATASKWGQNAGLKNANFVFRGIQKEAMKYMEANSIGDLNQYAEAHDIGLPELAKKFKDFGGISMTESERLSRSVAFMGYVSHLDQSGKFKGNNMALFQKAEELTNKSMANYRHTERAGMFNKTGTVGSAAAALQTFKVNQYNQLYDFAKHAKRTGDYTPLAAMLFVQITSAGLMGMYAIEEAEDLWNFIKRQLVELGVTNEELLASSPKQFIAQMPEILAYGALSPTFFGRDFSSRMSQGEPLSGIGSFAQDYAKQLAAFGEVVKELALGRDTTEARDKALVAASPASLRNWAEMNTTVTDEEGNPKASDGTIAYRRTQEDKDAKNIPLLGMRSLREGKTRDQDYRTDVYKSHVSRAQAVQAETILNGLKAGKLESVREAAEKYAKLGGDPLSLLNQLETSVLKRYFTKDEWDAINAKGPRAILNHLRTLEHKKHVR